MIIQEDVRFLSKYATQRGMVVHALLPSFFNEKNDWQKLASASPKQVANKIKELAEETLSGSTRTFFLQNSAIQNWVAGCYKQLFCLFHQWQVKEVLVEPHLGLFYDAQGDYIDLGQPDLLIKSPLFEGAVCVELKTALKGNRTPRKDKLARYMYGTERYLEQRDLPVLNRVIWLVFMSHPYDESVHWRTRSSMKIRTYHFSPNLVTQWLVGARKAQYFS